MRKGTRKDTKRKLRVLVRRRVVMRNDSTPLQEAGVE